MKKMIQITLIVLGLGFICVIFSNYYIQSTTENQCYNKVENIPFHKTAILLGTSKFLSNGSINLYYKYRIDAAVKLYQAGKCTYFIVSGDNTQLNYNEPEQMKASLIERGIPADHIFEDFAGVRTLDSIIRAEKIFGQTDYIIISQAFHDERALFLANAFHHNAVAFVAQDVSQYYGLKTQLREYFARVKALLDIYILNTEARFEGDPIQIP